MQMPSEGSEFVDCISVANLKIFHDYIEFGLLKLFL